MAKDNIKRENTEKLLANYLEEKSYQNIRNYKVSVNKNPYFLIITDSGFEIYFAGKKIVNNEEVLAKVELKYSFSWSDFNSVTLDKFATSTLLEFNTGFKLRLDKPNEFVKELKINGIEVKLVERKWYNKILGFRSKKKWKMVIASLAYLSILFSLINAVIVTDAEKAEIAAIEAKEAKEQSKLDAQKKAAAEARVEKEKKAQEEKAAQKKKAQEEKDALIVAFNIAANQMVEKSNGVIPNVTIKDEENYFQVNVYVNEITWASSNESEKLSFATTVGTSIENSLAPHDTYVDIRSATNKDVIASQKLFGGWKIKR